MLVLVLVLVLLEETLLVKAALLVDEPMLIKLLLADMVRLLDIAFELSVAPVTAPTVTVTVICGVGKTAPLLFSNASEVPVFVIPGSGTEAVATTATLLLTLELATTPSQDPPMITSGAVAAVLIEPEKTSEPLRYMDGRSRDVLPGSKSISGATVVR